MSKAKPAPKIATWRVVGGASSGGLVVRSSAKVTSAESERRLAKGSLVQELELAGERLRFRLLSGSGPQTGWVSTKFKGKDLLAQCPLKVGLLCTGSRGDIQPLIGLGLGLEKAGCSVTIFGHSEYADYVTDNGLHFMAMFDPLKGDDNEEEKKEDEAMETWHKSQLFFTRLAASTLHKCPIAGVSAQEDVPEEVLMLAPDFSPLAMGHCYEIAGRLGDMATAERLGAQLQAFSERRAAAAAAAAAAGTVPGGVDQAAPGPETAAPAVEPTSGREGAAEAAPPGEAAPTTEQVVPIHDPWSSLVEACKNDPCGVANLYGLSVLRFSTFFGDPEKSTGLIDMLENSPPDVILFHWGMGQTLGAAIDVKYGIPCIPFNLYNNVDPMDPRGLWLSEELWQLVRVLEPGRGHFATLEQARREYIPPSHEQGFDLFNVLAALDTAILEPLLGTSGLQQIGRKRWGKRMDEGNIVGFLSAAASKAVLDFLGPSSQELASKHTFVGFWMMSAEDQTTGADMFGGPKLMEELESFLDAGPKPVYIGWGSMVDNLKGAESMVVLAVSALKEAGVRGIVLGGWAKLTYEMLEETVGPNDAAGLCKYARKNVLFVEKAPQMWLFPKCAAIVIHGGSGTMAAAWSSGVPVIVVPVMVDQPGNGLLNMSMGAGLCTRNLTSVTALELSQSIKTVLASPEIKRGAQVVQVGMMRDKPIDKTIEAMCNFMAEEAVSNPRKSTKAMAREIFAKFDEDGDGFLNAQELSKFTTVCCGVEVPVDYLLELCCAGSGESPSEEDLRRGPSEEHLVRLYDDPKCRNAIGDKAPDVFLHHAVACGGRLVDLADKAQKIFDRFDHDQDGFWSQTEVWEWMSTLARTHLPWEYIEGEVFPKLKLVADLGGWTAQSTEDAHRGVPRDAITSLLVGVKHQMRFGSFLDVEDMYESVFAGS